MFLHFGLPHIFSEHVVPGRSGTHGGVAFYQDKKFIVLYLVTGVAGFALSAAASSGISAGASSPVIMGLIGILIGVSFHHGGLGKAYRSQLWRWVIYIGVLGVLGPMFGFGGVDNAAHIGGFLSGLTLGYLIPEGDPETRRAEILWNTLSVVSVLIMAGSFALMALQLNPTFKLVGLSLPVRSARRRLFRYSPPGRPGFCLPAGVVRVALLLRGGCCVWCGSPRGGWGGGGFRKSLAGDLGLERLKSAADSRTASTHREPAGQCLVCFSPRCRVRRSRRSRLGGVLGSLPLLVARSRVWGVVPRAPRVLPRSALRAVFAAFVPFRRPFSGRALVCGVGGWVVGGGWGGGGPLGSVGGGRIFSGPSTGGAGRWVWVGEGWGVDDRAARRFCHSAWRSRSLRRSSIQKPRLESLPRLSVGCGVVGGWRSRSRTPGNSARFYRFQG